MAESQTGASPPDEVLDQAFRWSVRLGSGSVTQTDRDRFEAWLAEHASHRMAWEQVEAVEQSFSLAARDPSAGRQTLESVAVQRRRRRLAARTLTFIPVLLGVLILLRGGWLPGSADHVASPGEHRTIAFDSGGEVHLRGGSAIDVQSLDNGRLVRLRKGEILVDSGGESNPMTISVSTPNARLTPVGTRFVVSRESNNTELAVLEGRVGIALQDSGGSVARAGQIWQIRSDSARRTKNDSFRSGAWVEGVIDVNSAPLDRVLEVLSRHHHGWLSYDTDLSSLRVTGVFQLNETDRALDAIERSLPVEVERTTDYWVRVRARK